MSISRTSKMNGVATQLHKKPMDCGYGGKVRAEPTVQRLVPEFKVDIVNHLIDEMLETDPTLETAIAVKKVQEYYGLREKES